MARILLLLTRTPWSDRRPFHRQAPALAADGHEILYMAGEPDEPVEHPFTWVPLTPAQRARARRTGALSLFSRVAAERPDVVQLCSLEQLPLGLALAVSRRCRVVYDCREDIASGLYERRAGLPMPLRRALFRGTRGLEGLAARHFDGIVTADPAVFGIHAGMPAERKHVFYNTALLSQFPPSYPALRDREFDLALLGSMGSLRSGAPMIVEALARLDAEGMALRAIFIGEPAPEVGRAIADAVRAGGLEERVEITGHLPHTQIAATLARARIGIVPLLDYPKFHHNIACKAFEYMACGMPSICSDLPPQRLFIHDGIGRFYPPGDLDALTDRIRALASDVDAAERMGAQARREVETRWNGELEQRKLVEFYRRLLAMPPRHRDPGSRPVPAGA